MVNTEVKEERGFPFLKPSRNIGLLSQLFRRGGHVLRRYFEMRFTTKASGYRQHKIMCQNTMLVSVWLLIAYEI